MCVCVCVCVCVCTHIHMCVQFTMIHIAASNPNPEVLEKVLNSDPNFLVSDAKGIRPVHIAAGCSAPDTLQLLLTKSVFYFPWIGFSLL